jgi:hypothetical protein
MKTISELLRESDPVAEDPALTDPEIAAMRRAVIKAAERAEMRAPLWTRPVAIAAMVVVMIAVGVTAGRRLPAPSATERVARSASVSPGGERRQLQFATPGGTRIIWTFDPQFTLKETMR